MKYKLYPTLLNTFARFERGLVTSQELLDRINRVPLPPTEAQLRGVSFEDAVIKGVDEDLFDPDIIIRARRLLPRPMQATQVYCEFPIDDVLFYGFVDVVGPGMAVDLKSTRSYSENRFLEDHQNFYLPALQTRGVKTLRYIVTDFSDLFVEEYDLQTDFSVQRRQIRSFVDFLEQSRHLITDRRIFIPDQASK